MPWQRKFLGFSFTGPNTQHSARAIAPHALERFRQRVREMTWRRRGVKQSSSRRSKNWASISRDGAGTLGFCETAWQLRDVDSWVCRRLRAVIWKEWKNGMKRVIAN